MVNLYGGDLPLTMEEKFGTFTRIPKEIHDLYVDHLRGKVKRAESKNKLKCIPK